jgi:hypothetical protein
MNPFSHFSIKTPVIYTFLFDLHTTGSSFIFMFLKNLRLTDFPMTRGLSTSTVINLHKNMVSHLF